MNKSKIIILLICLAAWLPRSARATKCECCCYCDEKTGACIPVLVPTSCDDGLGPSQGPCQDECCICQCPPVTAGVAGRGGLTLSAGEKLVILPVQPIWSILPHGPSFDFFMRYSSGHGGSRTNTTWAAGYRWSHKYGVSIKKQGNIYRVQGFSARGPAYRWTGSAFADISTNRCRIASYGRNALNWDGSSIVMRRKTWQSMTGGKDAGGCALCGGGSGKLPGSGHNSPPYSAWHASEGFLFDPDPVDTNKYRLAKVTGRDGQELTLNYAADNCITSIVSDAGNVFEFYYSDSGHITNITDVAGERSALFAYTNDLLAQVTDMGGQTLKFGYDNDGKLTSLKRPNMIDYDETVISYAADRVTMTYPEGNERYVYTGACTSRYDSCDGIGEWLREYRLHSWGGTPVKVTDSLGRTVTYQWYDEGASPPIKGKIKKVKCADGGIREYEYDSKGNITKISVYGTSQDLVTKQFFTHTYFSGTDNPSKIVIEEKDAQGNVLTKRSKEYTRDDKGTTNTTDDVYILASEKNWITADKYTETKYLYNTNSWLLEDIQVLVSGTNNYKITKSFAYNDDRQVVSVTDTLTNVTYFAYDSIGRVTNVGVAVSWGTNATQYCYDNLDRTTNVVHPDGFSESWVYAPCGCGTLTRTDRGGNVTSNSYNSNKWLSKAVATTTNGTVISHVEYLYDGAGNITNTIDVLGNVRTSVYDSENKLTNSTDELGRETEYLYDSYGRQYLTIYTDGTVSSNTYDAVNRVIKVSRYADTTSAVALTTRQYTYDDLGRRVTTTDSLGNVTSNTFNMAGRTVKVTYPDGSFTETEYDLLGNVTNRIDALGYSTVSSYDILDRLVSTTDPEGRATTWEYDPDWPWQMKYAINANGKTNQFNYYDRQTGWLLTNIVNGVKTVYEYNALGSVVKTTYPDVSYTQNIYDGPRLISQISRTGNTTSYGFDAAGRRTCVTNSLGNVTRYNFDAGGNVTNTIDALTNVTSYAYDSMNRLIETTLPDSRVSTNTYDSLGRLISRTGAGSVPVSYEYDALSRMTNLIDGVSNQTHFEYDSMGRLTKKTYADNSYYLYGYNAIGWLTNRVDAKSQATAYDYNNVGQLTKVDYPTNTDIESFYDNLGRMTNRMDTAGTWSWTYDGESSLVLAETTPYSQTATYSYNTNTYEMIKVALDSTNYTEYAWYQGRLTNITCSAGNFAYSYKPDSDLLETTTYLNGTCTVTRAYDTLHRLTSISAQSASSVVNSFSYVLDSTGRRTKRTDANGSHINWGYDWMDQLTNAVMTDTNNPAFAAAYNYGYEYDEVGNRLHQDRGRLNYDGTFNTLNQLTHLDWGGKLDIYGTITSTNPPCTNWVSGVTSILYTAVSPTQFLGGATVKNTGSNNIPIVTRDKDGNATEINVAVYMPPTKPQRLYWDANGNLTNDGYKAYSWTQENRLTAIQTTAVATNVGIPKHKSAFVYDGMGRRCQKTDYTGWNGSAYSTTNVSTFVYDGWNLIRETQVSGLSTQVSSYVWGLDLSQSLQGAGGIGGLLCVIRNGDRYFPCYDGNGNISDYLDVNGSVVAHREYDPFGRTVVSTGPMKNAFSFWFSTKYYEPFWKLYYYGYRYYSPELGRWPSRDPIGECRWMNVYSFLSANPVSLVDPVGLEQKLEDKPICCCCCAEDVNADIVRAIVKRPPPRLVFGHILRFFLEMSYQVKPPYNDCSYKWEESSDRAFGNVPADGQFHDVTTGADARGCTKRWRNRLPCVVPGDMVIFDDVPHWAWQANDLPRFLPWEWNHSIRITLKSGVGCPCTFTECTVTMKRYTKIKTLAKGDFELTADVIDKKCK